MAETPPLPWRATLKRRMVVRDRFPGPLGRRHPGRAWSTCRCCSTTNCWRAPSGSSRTRITASAKRGEIVDRSGKVHRPTAWTPIRSTPSRPRSPSQAGPRPTSARRSATASPRTARTLLGRAEERARVRLRAPPGVARAGAPRDGARRSRASARSRKAAATTRTASLAAALLGYVGLDNGGLGGIEATYDSLIKGHEGTVLVQADAHGNPFSREERPATSGATLELTIDHYLQFIAERELQGRRATRAAPPAARP